MNDAPIPTGRVTIERRGDARIVSLHGEHDISTADIVRERLADARMAAGEIIVDLTATTFIGSSIVAVLVNAYRADSPPRLRFVAAPGTPARHLFDQIDFDAIARVYERLEEALAASEPG